MSDLRLSIQKEVGKIFSDKTIVVNGKGDLSVDGTLVAGLDGARGVLMCAEGVGYDVKDRGAFKTKEMYVKKSLKQGELGNAMKAAIQLRRTIDADIIAGR